MLTVGLLLAQICLWLLMRYIAQGNQLQRKILLFLSVMLLVVWTVKRGFSDLLSFNIWLFLLALPISYLLYLISLAIVGTKFTKSNMMPFRCFHFSRKHQITFRRRSIRNIFTSTYEELLYRWFLFNALMELTQTTWVAVVITFLTFFAVHIRDGAAILQMVDIFVFSLAITLWFCFTVNPLYSIVIHIARNQLIICQKYITYQSDYESRLKYIKILQERRIHQNEQ